MALSLERNKGTSSHGTFHVGGRTQRHIVEKHMGHHKHCVYLFRVVMMNLFQGNVPGNAASSAVSSHQGESFSWESALCWNGRTSYVRRQRTQRRSLCAGLRSSFVCVSQHFIRGRNRQPEAVVSSPSSTLHGTLFCVFSSTKLSVDRLLLLCMSEGCSWIPSCVLLIVALSDFGRSPTGGV